MTITKQFLWLALGVLLIILFAFCNLKYGVIQYHFSDIFHGFLNPAEESISTITIMQIRLPMILMAIMAGSGLAIAGLLLQRITQNPLACPSLTGIEYGTAFSVTLSYLLMPQITRPLLIVIAFLGGLLTYLMMQTITKKTKANIAGITLIGIAFNTLYYSAIQVILLAFPSKAQTILYDLNGSLQTISMQDIKLIWIPFIVLLCFSFLLTKRLELLDLDEVQAELLGVAIKKFRLFALGLSIVLTTLLTSLIGPILFFGLIIPHLVKPFAKPQWIIFFCTVYGAAFLLIAQFFTQLITPKTPLPIGLITLLLASPLLILIIRRYFTHDASH